MSSLVGSSVSPLNSSNVSYFSTGYCKSGQKIVTSSIYARTPFCYSMAHNLKPADEFCPSKFNDNITRCLKKEGDQESDGEVLCEVETARS